MNIITRSVSNILKICAGNTPNLTNLTSIDRMCNNGLVRNTLNGIATNLTNTIQGIQQTRNISSLWQLHKRGPHKKVKVNKNPFGDQPFAKGLVLKTLIKKPKKPNSANRKCVLVRLSTGREMVAYVPGIGHNLQEHNVVLCQVGRCKDLPGVKIRCVRGKYDLPHVIKPTK